MTFWVLYWGKYLFVVLLLLLVGLFALLGSAEERHR